MSKYSSFHFFSIILFDKSPFRCIVTTTFDNVAGALRSIFTPLTLLQTPFRTCTRHRSGSSPATIINESPKTPPAQIYTDGKDHKGEISLPHTTYPLESGENPEPGIANYNG